jgi:hypothetical protein
LLFSHFQERAHVTNISHVPLPEESSFVAAARDQIPATGEEEKKRKVHWASWDILTTLLLNQGEVWDLETLLSSTRPSSLAKPGDFQTNQTPFVPG